MDESLLQMLSSSLKKHAQDIDDSLKAQKSGNSNNETPIKSSSVSHAQPSKTVFYFVGTQCL